MLLAHPDLAQVIEASWRAVPEEKAESTPFRTPDGWQKEPQFRCPDCGQPMEKYGYMGIAAIQIDRCEQCSLVWLDADELQNMVLALARSQYRSERALKAEEQDDLDLGHAGMPMQYRRNNMWLFGGNASGEVPLVAAQALLSLLLR